MANSKYIDVTATLQVIGNIYNNPMILDAGDKYFFSEEDFPLSLHGIVFEAIYNLFKLGASEITLEAVEDYLVKREKKYAIYQSQKGSAMILSCSENAKPTSFDYYYDRFKKMSLFRAYEKVAMMNLSWLYDVDNLFDLKKKQEQEDWLDNTSLEEIANTIDNKIMQIKMEYVDGSLEGECHAGEGIDELITQLEETPEVGYPLFGKYINTVLKGARLKKFYVRSAATGVGKSRSMVADACSIGCSQMYDLDKGEWVSTGAPQPTMYIATEQALDEVQTMILAFLSAVEEEHILNGEYLEGERERVIKAAQILKAGKLYFKALPDFSLLDIENTIKRGVREHGVQYIFHDYIHTSMKILEEITKRSGGVKLREDNILFMISIRLKDLCNQYGIFILTATQLNASYQDSETPDHNLLRGAKSIADKIDAGLIMLETTTKDLEALAPLLEAGYEEPVIKISVYKNRRGRYKGIYMWCKANRGICRIEPIFVTKWNYELIEMEDIKINVKEESAF